MTRVPSILAAALVAVLAVSGPRPAAAQEKYPTRPVEVVVTWGPGGGADSMARQLSQLAQPHLGVALPVVNAPGGSGNTGLARVLSGRPDGYQVATYIMDTLATIPLGLASYKIDDLAWVVRTQVADSFLFVKGDSQFQTIDALLKHAKANPGKLRVAATGFGTVDDLTVRYLGHRGFPMTVVPYAKPGERYAAVVGGHNEVLYEQAGDVKSFLESKQLKAVMIFAAKRHPAFPDVPASGELDFDVELPQFRGIVAKAGTPPDRLKTLADAFRRAMGSDEWQKFAADWYMRPDSYMGPDQFEAWIAKQEKTLGAYVREFGLKSK